MKLSDLKFVGKKPPPDLTKTQLLRNRVKTFLESTEKAEPPTDFENPNDGDRQIELDIFLPKSQGDNGLQLPLENLSDDESSDSSSTSSDSDVESIKEHTYGPMVEEIDSSDDLIHDDNGCSISDEEFGSDNNSNEACGNQTPPLLVSDNNQDSYLDPRLSVLVNALLSPEFIESEFPKSKQPLIEEVLSKVEVPSNSDDSPPPKRLKTDNCD
ncbi:unnamed protein product [Rodentolepis nana]|uniref:LEM domain-containing protein n=1 Tax=Rodentolepis nana TaxID=102285 RepID=A0A0R3TMX0_RODNA|nr:unnamed protein product [Rodentolepis nana]